MIVVEGPDGAGKSTLCKRLCEHFDLEMGERGTTNRDELYKCTREDTWRAIHGELLADKPSLVWDRLGPWSDPIYSHAQGRPCAFTPTELLMVKDIFTYLDIPLIFCLPPIDVVKQNVLKHHQMEGVTDNIDFIYRKYREASNRTFSFYYDYTKNSFDSIQIQVQTFLGYRKERELLA